MSKLDSEIEELYDYLTVNISLEDKERLIKKFGELRYLQGQIEETKSWLEWVHNISVTIDNPNKKHKGHTSKAELHNLFQARIDMLEEMDKQRKVSPSNSIQRIRDDLYESLAKQAKQNKRSVRAELEVILEKELLLTVPPIIKAVKTLNH